jgi:hypothetical protein
MSVFPGWQEFAVPQKRPGSGCIPTGYEFILRAAGAKGIDWSRFQDEFDLDRERRGTEPSRNNFKAVASAVAARYPHVSFQVAEFASGRGCEKLQFIEQHVSRREPILISLALAPFGQDGCWHIMPVVDMDESGLVLLHSMQPNGQPNTMQLAKAELVRIHDEFDGGNDVAYLERC